MPCVRLVAKQEEPQKRRKFILQAQKELCKYITYSSKYEGKKEGKITGEEEGKFHGVSVSEKSSVDCKFSLEINYGDG